MDIIEKAKNIELVIFDIDGVMTDGRLYFDNNGDEYKAFLLMATVCVCCRSAVSELPLSLAANLNWSNTG